MPTHRFASLCVLTSLLLFSCNNKKNTGTIAGNAVSSPQYDTVNVLPDEAVDIKKYNTGFIENITQHFTALAKKISIITAKNGLKLTIDPAALEAEDGTVVEGKVDVDIIELTNSTDLFKSNAATVSDGRLLSSGGSYFVGMECNGKKLRIKKGKGMQVVFPRLADEEMALFYGERDAEGAMNWKETGKGLGKQYIKNTTATSGDYVMEPVPPTYDLPGIEKNTYHLFNSMDSKVSFLDKMITVKDWVSYLQKKDVSIIIDTLYYSWNRADGKVVYSYEKAKTDVAFSGMQFRILPTAVWNKLKIQKDSLANASCVAKEGYAKAYADYIKAYEVYQKQNGETSPAAIAEQLQKYYAPTTVGTLGWINCDRFYQNNQNTDVDLDIPITLNKSNIEYFVIFKSFNGLLRYRKDLDNQTKIVLNNVPIGQKVTLIAFAKNKEGVYLGQEDFTIERNKKVTIEFNSISKEELNKIFRSNVKS